MKHLDEVQDFNERLSDSASTILTEGKKQTDEFSLQLKIVSARGKGNIQKLGSANDYLLILFDKEDQRLTWSPRRHEMIQGRFRYPIRQIIQTSKRDETRWMFHKPERKSILPGWESIVGFIFDIDIDERLTFQTKKLVSYDDVPTIKDPTIVRMSRLRILERKEKLSTDDIKDLDEIRRYALTSREGDEKTRIQLLEKAKASLIGHFVGECNKIDKEIERRKLPRRTSEEQDNIMLYAYIVRKTEENTELSILELEDRYWRATNTAKDILSDAMKKLII
jgi:hypothetical protein